MSKVTCDVCGREIDSRGLSGHMKTHPDTQGIRSPKGSQHKKKEQPKGDNGVISYPSNKQEIKKTSSVVGFDVSQGLKKPVKKPVASNQTSKPDPRGEKNAGSTNTGHPKDSGVKEPEKEWQGLFR